MQTFSSTKALHSWNLFDCATNKMHMCDGDEIFSQVTQEGAHLHGLLQGRGDAGRVGVCMRHALAERHVVARKAHAFARRLLPPLDTTPLSRQLSNYKEPFGLASLLAAGGRNEAVGVEAGMILSAGSACQSAGCLSDEGQILVCL